MFVGIICACMPSVAKSCHRHLPSYDTMRALLSGSFKSDSKRNTYTSFPDSDNKSSGDRAKKAQWKYSESGLYQGPQHSQLGENNHLRTFIQGGRLDDIEDDGIHLTFEMRTTSQ